tara:strand:- start:120 stop:980 length:861 start_codon:yes stop_codon:yes gene_type:complete
MTNPYLIKEPSVISFSGGRTSALMLYKMLEANNGLPEIAKVAFANTGKEMPETLDFVQECSQQWGVQINWLELDVIINEEGKYKYATKIVDYKSASRKGEPFSALIESKNYTPNPVARFCTQELKILRQIEFMKVFFDHWTAFIGIRADETRRAKKIHNKQIKYQDQFCPLYVDGITKQEVSSFWKKQKFDLKLPANNGATIWGNCDLCFLKGYGAKLSIIRERPDLAKWWIDQEKKMDNRTKQKHKGLSYFSKDHPSYSRMEVIASDQGKLFDFDDESIPCFCGD